MWQQPPVKPPLLLLLLLLRHSSPTNTPLLVSQSYLGTNAIVDVYETCLEMAWTEKEVAAAPLSTVTLDRRINTLSLGAAETRVIGACSAWRGDTVQFMFQLMPKSRNIMIIPIISGRLRTKVE
jgi:hypothetical protein